MKKLNSLSLSLSLLLVQRKKSSKKAALSPSSLRWRKLRRNLRINPSQENFFNTPNEKKNKKKKKKREGFFILATTRSCNKYIKKLLKSELNFCKTRDRRLLRATRTYRPKALSSVERVLNIFITQTQNFFFFFKAADAFFYLLLTQKRKEREKQ